MPAADFTIAAGADDGMILFLANGSPYKLYPGNGDVVIGQYDATYPKAEVWYRFLVTLPRNIIITAAYLRPWEYGSDAAALTRIYGVDEANPVVPATPSDYVNRKRTTNYTDWNNAGGSGRVNSPSVAPIVQELVDKHDYSNGSAMMFFHQDNGSPALTRQHYLGFEINPSYAVVLHVEWVPADFPVVTDISRLIITRGDSASVIITGVNLDTVTDVVPYDKDCTIEDPSITVTSFTIDSPTQITANITTSAGTALGYHGVGIVNPVGEALVPSALWITAVARAPLDPGRIASTFSYGLGWRYLADNTAATAQINRTAFIQGMVAAGLNTYICAFDATVFAKLSESAALVAAALADFTAAGVKVYASWNNSQAFISAGWDDLINGRTIRDFIDAVLTWNASHPAGQRFAGIHFDLEPLDSAHGGGTAEVNKAHLELVAQTLATMRDYSINGQTVEGQGLPVSLFADPRYGNDLCLPAWREVVNQLDIVQVDHYRWDHSSRGIDTAVNNEAAVIGVTVELGRYFTVCLSVDELSKNYESADPYASFYQLGRRAADAFIAAYDDFYGAYPTYAGYDLYMDAGGFNSWHFIQEGVEFPSGARSAGQVIQISYNTRRMTERYTHRAYGVKMELRDASGTIWETSRIVDLLDLQTTARTISMILPNGVADGNASIRLSLWAVSWYDDNYYDKLWYGDYAGYNDQLLAMSMDELAVATVTPAGAAFTGKRNTFFLLQDSGWVEGVTIGQGAAIPPSVTTGEASASEHGAALSVSLGDMGSSGSVEVLVAYGLTQEVTLSSGSIIMTAPGSNSITLSGLLPNTTYYYMAVAIGDNGQSASGALQTFTTLPSSSNIHVTDIKVPASAVVGQNAVIAVTVSNLGDTPETGVVSLGGDFEAIQQVTLAAGEEKTVYFVVVPPNTGTFAVNVNGVEAVLTVGTATTGASVPIALALGLLSAIVLARRRSR